MRTARTGLRTRLTAAFGLGAMLLSISLATLSYELVRSSLLDQRSSSSVRETYSNARLLRDRLLTRPGDLPTSLRVLATGPDTASLVRHAGDWYSTHLGVNSQNLPADLLRRADLGQAASQRFRLAGTPQFGVAIPLPSVDAEYFEVFSLGELDQTLRAFLTFLALAALITTLGGAAVGYWASRRVLVPLRDVADAAVRIAGGDFATRLETGPDGDLTALAASFNSMVQTLTERIERDTRFASDVSHEMRSPLTTMRTSFDVLSARRDELSARGREALGLLGEDLKRFQRLVLDLLEISRFDAGVICPALEQVNLAELVGHTLERIGANACPVDVTSPEIETTVMADKRRLERVLVNLVENANTHGRGLRSVAVRAEGRAVRITIDDDGPGVPTELRLAIFDRFSRGAAASARASDGVGLGLSLVAEQIRVQGGRVWVEDCPGGGARFVVELPKHER